MPTDAGRPPRHRLPAGSGAEQEGRSARAGAPNEGDEETGLEETFDRTLDEGRRRLSRRLPSLLLTGLVGGIDVGFGVLAYLIVDERTGNQTLAGIAFSLGFVALALAGSELFTEDFLVPVITVVSRQCPVWSLFRLWLATLAMNLLGGWIITWLVVTGYPELRPTAVRTATHYEQLDGTGRGFALAMMAGAAMALMTWMQHSTTSQGVKLVPAIMFATLLAGGGLFHSVLDSLYMFAALHTGHAPFGYVDWLGALGWATLGNLVGGVGLVTVLRLGQVQHKVAEERESPA